MKKKQKEKKHLNALMALFIAVLMVGSILGLMWSGNADDDLNYKDYKFKVVGNQISTKINDVVYYFYYHPTDLLSMNVSEEADSILDNVEMVYLTFDPEADNIEYIESTRFELAQEFIKTGKVMMNGQIKEDRVYNYPIITCDNATEFIPVIYLMNGGETQIYSIGNCIMAESAFEQAFIALKDKIMYMVLGVL